jgi:hypothetical protein
MKAISLLTIVVVIAIGLSSCNPEHINPQQTKTSSTVTAKSDTNKTLITNTELVGTWNVVTDTVAFLVDTMYHGQPGDHYIFTKYGNIYINNNFDKFIDTGVYNISHDTVQWASSYISQVGSGGYGLFFIGPFTISNLSNTSLVLTQFVISPDGYRYEQIALKKEQ